MSISGIGDVGSGKTVIAILSLVKAIENGYQGALMAPTEILALQHYGKIKELLEPLNIHVGLLTGSLKVKEKRQILEGLADGTIDLVIGTHALIQDNVIFKNLGLVVTDEQHRFGVNQRAKLEGKREYFYNDACEAVRDYCSTSTTEEAEPEDMTDDGAMKRT